MLEGEFLNSADFDGHLRVEIYSDLINKQQKYAQFYDNNKMYATVYKDPKAAVVVVRMEDYNAQNTDVTKHPGFFAKNLTKVMKKTADFLAFGKDDDLQFEAVRTVTHAPLIRLFQKAWGDILEEADPIMDGIDEMFTSYTSIRPTVAPDKTRYQRLPIVKRG